MTFICTSTEPVVETKAGKIRGFKFDSTYHFYGIDYGKAKRFEQPEPVEPWEGVKDALSYGYITYPFQPDSPNGDLMVPHRFWPKSEDCLNLNIWTPSIDKNAKKAVMVWLHGGGFAAGSAIEMVAYDGKNLSEYGDVVVVSVNHRLNVFGFLDVSEFGEKYANSQNAGIADLVLAMHWIHDNIANFGGDPENVTIHGQSGGGSKVMTLMQVAEADGTFQRAIIQSGSSPSLDLISWKSTKRFADRMFEKLGVEPNIETLLEMPAEDLLKLAQEANPKEFIQWGPIENGYFDRPLISGATEHAKTISLMVGTCFGEFSTFGLNVPNRANMTKEEKEAVVFEKFGEEKGRKLLDLFYKAYPGHDALDAIVLDDNIRTTSRMILDQRANDGLKETYGYMLGYTFPFDGGKAAWHCAEIPFVFHNIDKVPICNEAGIGEKLQNEICTAWVNFAKTGNPNNEYLPKWEPYEKGHEVTMVFDRESEPRVDYDRELVEYHKELKYAYEHPDMLM